MKDIKNPVALVCSHHNISLWHHSNFQNNWSRERLLELPGSEAMSGGKVSEKSVMAGRQARVKIELVSQPFITVRRADAFVNAIREGVEQFLIPSLVLLCQQLPVRVFLQRRHDF